jgi:hypothetical protein
MFYSASQLELLQYNSAFPSERPDFINSDKVNLLQKKQDHLRMVSTIAVSLIVMYGQHGIVIIW